MSDIQITKTVSTMNLYYASVYVRSSRNSDLVNKDLIIDAPNIEIAVKKIRFFYSNYDEIDIMSVELKLDRILIS